MAKYKYDQKIEQIWEQADHCNCGVGGSDGCNPNNHRLCGICYKPIFYGAHESVISQRNSRGAWNIDHKIPLSKGGTDKNSNLQAVHISCNRWKGNS